MVAKAKQLALTARAVRRATHPIHWTPTADGLVSPETLVGDRLVTVVLHVSRFGCTFPPVEVLPGGTYRSWNPWGWASTLLRLIRGQQEYREAVQRLLLASGMDASREK